MPNDQSVSLLWPQNPCETHNILICKQTIMGHPLLWGDGFVSP